MVVKCALSETSIAEANYSRLFTAEQLNPDLSISHTIFTKGSCYLSADGIITVKPLKIRKRISPKGKGLDAKTPPSTPFCKKELKTPHRRLVLKPYCR